MSSGNTAGRDRSTTLGHRRLHRAASGWRARTGRASAPGPPGVASDDALRSRVAIGDRGIGSARDAGRGTRPAPRVRDDALRSRVAIGHRGIGSARDAGRGTTQATRRRQRRVPVAASPSFVACEVTSSTAACASGSRAASCASPASSAAGSVSGACSSTMLSSSSLVYEGATRGAQAPSGEPMPSARTSATWRSSVEPQSNDSGSCRGLSAGRLAARRQRCGLQTPLTNDWQSTALIADVPGHLNVHVYIRCIIEHEIVVPGGAPNT